MARSDALTGVSTNGRREAPTPHGGGTTGRGRSRRAIVLGLAVFAFVRVAASALGFPLFGHLDELSHLDTALKYSHSHSPALPKDAAFEPETAPYFALHNSPEYALPPGPDGPAPRGSDLAAAAAAAGGDADITERYVEVERQRLRATRNHQTYENPLYYWIAAEWLRAVRAVGVGTPADAYALRLLGALCLALGVVLSHVFVREALKPRDDTWLSLGVPAVVAFWPQDVYAFLNNDHLSIVVATIALIAMTRLARVAKRPTASPRRATIASLATGLLVGVALAHKQGNLGLLGFAVPCVWPWLRSSLIGRARGAILGLLAFGVGVAAPVLAWRTALHARTGYWDGTRLKCDWLGVSNHDWAGVIAHPLWSIDGIWTFVTHLGGSFWRGEIQWHGQLMANPWTDGLLVASGLVCVVAAFGRRSRTSEVDVPMAVIDGSFLAITIAVASLAVASVAWNYGPNTYPSSDFPFLVSGRVISGLGPVVFLLYLVGLERLLEAVLGPLRARRVRWVALFLLLATLLGSEIADLRAVTNSPHNFWHLDG